MADLLLVWLILQTLKFPKSQRFVLAKVRPNREVLVKADVELEKVRLHLRLAQELKLLNAGQYEHASRAVVDIGRLLGGWLKRDPHGREANGACVAARGTTTPTTRARLTGAWCAPLG